MTDAPGEPAEGSPSPTRPPQPGYGYGPAPGPVPGHLPGSVPGYVPGYVHVPVRPDHPDATKAMVLGIVSLIGGLTCYLPLVLGPYAWVVGRRAVREIDADPERLDGRSQAMSGYVMGVIATVVMVVGVLVVAAFLVFLAVAWQSEPMTPIGSSSL